MGAVGNFCFAYQAFFLFSMFDTYGISYGSLIFVFIVLNHCFLCHYKDKQIYKLIRYANAEFQIKENK